jgi:hypothetical protein
MLKTQIKSFLKVLIPNILLLILLVPFSISASQEYPESKAGLPVVFVKNAKNTASLPGDATVIVLYAGNEKIEDVYARLEKEENVKAQGYSIEIFGGPNTSPEKYRENHKQYQETITEYGVNRITDYERTFTVFQNDDVGSYTLNGLSVELHAPVKGDNQDDWSAFLLNCVTDESPQGMSRGFAMQVGFIFPTSSQDSYCCYTDDKFGLAAQDFSGVDYIEEDDYFFYIYYIDPAGPSEYWCLGIEDIDTEDWQVYVEYDFYGDSLEQNLDWENSVWFENANYTSDPDWYDGFDDYLTATNAKDCYNSYTWTS